MKYLKLSKKTITTSFFIIFFLLIQSSILARIETTNIRSIDYTDIELTKINNNESYYEKCLENNTEKECLIIKEGYFDDKKAEEKLQENIKQYTMMCGWINESSGDKEEKCLGINECKFEDKLCSIDEEKTTNIYISEFKNNPDFYSFSESTIKIKKIIESLKDEFTKKIIISINLLLQKGETLSRETKLRLLKEKFIEISKKIPEEILEYTSNENIASLLQEEVNKYKVVQGQIIDKNKSAITQAAITIKFIEENYNSNTTISAVSDKTGLYKFFLKPGTYSIEINKDGYYYYKGKIIISETSDAIKDIVLEKVSLDLDVNLKIKSSSETNKYPGCFISLYGRNQETDQQLWFGKECNFGETTKFQIPSGFDWKADIKADNHLTTTKFVKQLTENINYELTLTFIGGKDEILEKTLELQEDESIIQEGLNLKISKKSVGFKRDLILKSRITKALPEILGYVPIKDRGIKVELFDKDKLPITEFDDDIELELKYKGADLIHTNKNLTIDDIINLQIYFYNEKTNTWSELYTETFFEGIDISQYSPDKRIQDIENFKKLHITLKAQTNHFTLFTSLVSSVAENAEEDDLMEGIDETIEEISKYLGETSQAITLTAGENIEDVIVLVRGGEQISLSDILADSSDEISEIGNNFVNFAIGDILSTSEKGSIKIDFDGYNSIGLAPGSALKILEATESSLSYENLNGDIKYEFENRGDDLKYQVKGNLSYATIRGTTLEVNTEGNKETYKLIEGKIDVYNSILDETTTMNAGDSFTVYDNGNQGDESWTIPEGVSQEAFDVAKIMYENEITKINPEETSYNKTLTRWEAALLIGRFATKILNKEFTINSCTFNDIGDLHPEVQGEIIDACKLGLFKGENGNFLPNNTVTKGQIVIVLARLLTDNASMELNDAYDYLLGENIIDTDDRDSSFGIEAVRYQLYDMIYKATQ